jgi:hypothetical protein
MPLYFFHLSFGDRRLPDEEGVELPNRSAGRLMSQMLGVPSSHPRPDLNRTEMIEPHVPHPFKTHGILPRMPNLRHSQEADMATTTPTDLSASTSDIRSRENAPSAGQRHPQPIRPMRELVFNFIKRLLQQEKIEKTIGGVGGLRPKPRVVQ